MHSGHPSEVGLDVSVFTRSGVERIQRFALDLARSRPQKKLTFVTKSNAQRHGMVMWDDIFDQLRSEYRDLIIDKMLVDAMTTRMVLDPKSIDVVVATNPHADILSDLAAALSGSMGIAPTANLNPEREFPSMFEPIHGSAFDIMGKGIANPIASILSAAMLLDHFTLYEEAAMIRKGVNKSLKLKVTTPDLNESNLNITTSRVGDFIEDFIHNPDDSNLNFQNIHLGQSTII